MTKQNLATGQRRQPQAEAWRKRCSQRRCHQEPETEQGGQPVYLMAEGDIQAQHIRLQYPHSSMLQRQIVVMTIEDDGKAVLEHIQTELHEKCGHGAEIDAILHADRDSCE